MKLNLKNIQKASLITLLLIFASCENKNSIIEILLNRKAKKHTLLSLFDPENGTRWGQVVKPISLWRENE